jgi:hypothetical protein
MDDNEELWKFVQQLQIAFQGLSTQVSFILDILSQHRAAMRQQYDEVDAIRSQVEHMQEQEAWFPWYLQKIPPPKLLPSN